MLSAESLVVSLGVLMAAVCMSAKTVAAETTEKPVAFQTTDTPARYVTARPRGGLNVSDKKLTPRSTFVLVDLNGGALADNDTVNVRWAPSGSKPTYWKESGEVVNRVGGKPGDAGVFTVVFKDKPAAGEPQRVVLKTAGEKFVSTGENADALPTTDTADKATTFELIENPTPPADKPKPPADEKPAP